MADVRSRFIKDAQGEEVRMTKPASTQAYIDVRGPHPIYIKGQKAIKLVGASRSIEVAEAEAILEGRNQ